MEEARTDPEPHAFSMRLWPEELGSGAVEWRGRVQHLDTGEFQYFRDWETLAAFIRTAVSDAQALQPAVRPPGGVPR